MTMRRGKLQWSGPELNVMCDRCGRSRTVGDHSICSAERKQARSRESLAVVKAELLKIMQEQ